ncbi:MAG: hypothetical protein ACQEQG_09645 [Bacillota bacterium]
MRLRNLTYSAVSLALVAVSFMLFRGVTNILNSIVVPLILYFNLRRHDWPETAVTMLALLILTGLFFMQQLFFVILYLLLSLLLGLVMHEELSRWAKITLMTAGAAFGYFITIRLSDFMLGTNIQAALLAITAGSFPRYLILLMVEALVTAVGLVLLANILRRRIE